MHAVQHYYMCKMRRSGNYENATCIQNLFQLIQPLQLAYPPVQEAVRYCVQKPTMRHRNQMNPPLSAYHRLNLEEARLCRRVNRKVWLQYHQTQIQKLARPLKRRVL